MSDRDEAVHVATVILEGKNFGPGGRSLLARQFLLAMEERAWRDISTAPRDGTEVLLYGIWSGEISGDDPTPDLYIGSCSYEKWVVSGGDYYAAYINPSKWMPLPAPPPEETPDV